MEGGHHQDAALFEKDPVFPGDLDVRLDELHGGDAPQAHQDFRPQQGELVPQPGEAGLLLLGLGVPVLGRAALYHVGDVDVGVPVQVHRGQELVQKLAAPAHEGLPLQVLVLPGALAHEHHLGLPGPGAEHHVVPPLAQAAVLAAEASVFQVVPIFVHRYPSQVVFPYCSTRKGERQIPFFC